jgi:2-oxoglutarate dehydrogenase E1 component
MIDQYISAAEDKMEQSNGLQCYCHMVMKVRCRTFISQNGAIYSSVPTKTCSFVADCTTPANFFHLLRRQMKTTYEKNH